MEIFPSEYQQLDLTRAEKIFIRHTISSNIYGFLLLHCNPTMQKDDFFHILITSDGIILLKFFENFEQPIQFQTVMSMYASAVHPSNAKIIANKLISNKALLDNKGNLRVAVSVVYVFPKLTHAQASTLSVDNNFQNFINDHCLFAESFSQLRGQLETILIAQYLKHPISPISESKLPIADNTVNSMIQRLAPEYVTIRVSLVEDSTSKTGADNELLVVTSNDIAVKAFRLDTEQINIINKINKGDQLILACAGSGKSVLLISKCFKAAAMNPDKQFLITCYNENLHSLYTWFIDRAGLRAKNVTCLTFHKLCKQLLSKNGQPTPYGDFNGWIDSTIIKMNAGQIKERFYGIFIDEVQEFSLEWYKLCFNLLENKNSDDHLFVICGDKTQKIKSQQKHGKAPWNAGEGYPTYRGGNKNIRIEKNYRNCIEINEYINRFVSNAKHYLYNIENEFILDPDMFLRGQAVYHGKGVKIVPLYSRSNHGEAKAIISSINTIHDNDGIPYDEIAIVMYNASYKKNLNGWIDRTYNLENTLTTLLESKDIPYCRLYSTSSSWSSHYGENGGVKLIKFASVLGLDFRAAIVCGLKPLGEYQNTKKPDWESLKENNEKYLETLNYVHTDIRNLYVACTRAKEVLHIILPETKEESEYMRLLEESL